MKKTNKIVIPYLIWMALLIVIPTLLMLILSLSETRGIRFDDIEFTTNNIKTFFQEEYYISAIKKSIKYSFIVTIICLLIAFPIAYFISSLKTKNKSLILLLIILPMWCNMLLRILALKSFFQPINILNMIGVRLDLLGSDFAIIFGMVSIFLPFMIFPIFTSLEKIDKSLIESSRDLGSSSFTTLRKVIIPLSKAGIISGITMVLLPAMTTFSLPETLGGGNIILIGNIIERSFMKSANFNIGSLISLIMLMIILIPTLIMFFKNKEGDKYE